MHRSFHQSKKKVHERWVKIGQATHQNVLVRSSHRCTTKTTCAFAQVVSLSRGIRRGQRTAQLGGGFSGFFFYECAEGGRRRELKQQGDPINAEALVGKKICGIVQFGLPKLFAEVYTVTHLHNSIQLTGAYVEHPGQRGSSAAHGGRVAEELIQQKFVRCERLDNGSGVGGFCQCFGQSSH